MKKKSEKGFDSLSWRYQEPLAGWKPSTSMRCSSGAVEWISAHSSSYFIKGKRIRSQVWWCLPRAPALGRKKQDAQEFKVILSCKASGG